MSRRLYVVTGAFSCGKTTTLRHLAATRGYTVYREAPLLVFEDLGPRIKGHPPGHSFQAIREPTHLCPMCRPLEFAEMVLAKQAIIEANAAEGAILERGYLDPVEYYLRKTGRLHYPLDLHPWRFARYAQVFVFAVVPEAQQPRWNKTKEECIAEAEWINERLLRIYVEAGFQSHVIRPGSIEERADIIHQLITKCD